MISANENWFVYFIINTQLFHNIQGSLHVQIHGFLLAPGVCLWGQLLSPIETCRTCDFFEAGLDNLHPPLDLRMLSEEERFEKQDRRWKV